MPKVQEQGNSIPSSLHYALTDSQCNKCGAQLEGYFLREKEGLFTFTYDVLRES